MTFILQIRLSLDLRTFGVASCDVEYIKFDECNFISKSMLSIS